MPGLRQVAAAIFTAPGAVRLLARVLPSMLSGLFDVLVPLRLDALGASGVAVGAAFLIAAALEAFSEPAIGRFSDRRGRLLPIRAGLDRLARWLRWRRRCPTASSCSASRWSSSCSR